jgi:hypothetical protein
VKSRTAVPISVTHAGHVVLVEHAIDVGGAADDEVVQLVAYVQSMSGHSSIDSLPGRSDHLKTGTPENARPAQTPVPAGAPR